eukprot:CAMPEP_0181353338 /NCGR_PEP_ID=MMETSP1106-20121128/2784_1 /TAXON_ID=81844 /ORGANISM="Mantoniella antarctica, Strain SL-175" /LENGTH=127 /DNA_ID=CAMNT_0023465947 /DNA_START=120 /DNA_END=499 /DNA_ORIENTATION=-
MTSKAEYLKRYLEGCGPDGGSGGGVQDQDKKKRKRKKPPGAGGDAGVRVKKIGSGIHIVDEDVDDWKHRGGKEEIAKRDEETPVVLNADGTAAASGEADVAAKARKRAYLGIKEDGSGWAVAEEEGA